MNITSKTKICMIIGDPVEHSLSPKMHNAAYKKLGIENEYIYLDAHIKPESLKKAVEGVRTLQINGVSVTLPHKEKISQYLDRIDDIARKIGAVNTIMNRDGVLIGYNTDWLGVIRPLEKVTNIKDKKIAIIGAGGAARAAAYGLSLKGAYITYYNRTLEKALYLASEFGGEAKSIEHMDEMINSDIIINATSIGLSPKEKETPLPIENINSNHIVFDLVYTLNGDTQLIKNAKTKKAQTISGIDMLLHQGIAQFKLFTGLEAPEDAMRGALS